MENYEIENILRNALNEDIGHGDLTTNICIPEDKESEAIYIAKEDGVLCGTSIVEKVYNILDSNVDVEFYFKDGDKIVKGDIIGKIAGKARSLLSGERVALNFFQHLSGIATVTNEYVKQVEGYNTKIVDTRKTTPNLRVLEKYAVTVGGGYNHRFGLYDGIMIKDNHIAGAGGIKPAVELAKANIPHTLKIEVEVSNLDELKEALNCGADIIMLDNMDLEEMGRAVNIAKGKAIIEASGNMGDKDLKAVAALGIDIISIGALTNCFRGLDISLKFK